MPEWASLIDEAEYCRLSRGETGFKDEATLLAAEPALAGRIHAGGPDVWAQVVYAASHEWACNADDVLRRRTTVEVRGLATDAVRAEVAAMLARTGVGFELARGRHAWWPRRRQAAGA